MLQFLQTLCIVLVPLRKLIEFDRLLIIESAPHVVIQEH